MRKNYRFAILGILMNVAVLLVMPLVGQAANVAPVNDSQAIASAIQCYAIPNFDARAEYCILNSPNDSAVQLDVIRSKDTGIIQHTNLIGEAQQVTLGDLVAALGQPSVQQAGNRVNFMWASSGVTVSAFSSSVEVSNSLPIWRIVFATQVSNQRSSM